MFDGRVHSPSGLEPLLRFRRHALGLRSIALGATPHGVDAAKLRSMQTAAKASAKESTPHQRAARPVAALPASFTPGTCHGLELSSTESKASTRIRSASLLSSRISSCRVLKSS